MNCKYSLASKTGECAGCGKAFPKSEMEKFYNGVMVCKKCSKEAELIKNE